MAIVITGSVRVQYLVMVSPFQEVEIQLLSALHGCQEGVQNNQKNVYLVFNKGSMMKTHRRKSLFLSQ